MAKQPPLQIDVTGLDVYKALIEYVDALHQAIDRGAEDGTLDCVVKGQTYNDGRPAEECPQIISNPFLMCAGCRIRTVRKTMQEVEA